MKEVIEAISEIMEKVDPSVEENTFTFNSLYRVGMGPEGALSIPRIFGASKSRRLLQFAENLRKVKKPFKSFEARLPADSVIFYRTDKKGLIVASPKKDLVLKIFLDKPHIPLLQDEIRTLEHLQTTEFAPFAAKLKSYGENWIVTNFSGNSKALQGMRNPEKYLIENYVSLLLPAMNLFYKAHPWRVMSLQEWIASACARMSAHPSKDLLQKLVDRIEKESQKFSDYQVLEGSIHHDLHAGNILLDENQVTIIDWEGGTRGLILIDILDFSRRYINRHKMVGQQFWKFIAGKGELPNSVSTSFKNYANWSKETFNAHVPKGSERLTIYIYVIERSLLLYEKRKVDRLKDKSSFEFKMLEAVE